MYGREKGWRSVNVKLKKILKIIIKKKGKKNENDLDADVAKRERNSIKRYLSAFSNI